MLPVISASQQPADGSVTIVSYLDGYAIVKTLAAITDATISKGPESTERFL